jgi:hypothetical protein
MSRAKYINAISEAFTQLQENTELKAELFGKAKAKNAWFSIDNLEFCLEHWTSILNNADLSSWTEPYKYTTSPKTVGVIMAGNIPLVGFHDLLCVVLSGHQAHLKLSSDDEVLLKFIISQIHDKVPESLENIQIVERIKDVDAVIATGSNNSSRYFESYFGQKPNIIRKNRTSLAIISGNESKDDLEKIGEDIYKYFGLGCRNVSALAIPQDYDLSTFLYAIEPFVKVMDHHKYANNYTYHKAIWLMDSVIHYDNGFMCFKEDKNIHAPLGTLNYWRYESEDELKSYLEEINKDIQCIVSADSTLGDVKPGESQVPALDDYADKINVMSFLEKL